MLSKLKKFVDVKEGKEDELKDYLEGLGQPTPEGVKEFLETDEGRKIIQPLLDKYHAKSLESWKANNLEKLTQEAVEKAIAEKYPEETEEQKRLKKLEQELDSERKARNREYLRNKALSYATEKGLPQEIVDHFLGDDEDATLQNLGKLEEVTKKLQNKWSDEIFKKGGRKPHKDEKEPGKTLTLEDVAKMSESEINARWSEIEQLNKLE